MCFIISLTQFVGYGIRALSLVAVLAMTFAFFFFCNLWEVHFSALSCFGECLGAVLCNGVTVHGYQWLQCSLFTVVQLCSANSGQLEASAVP